MGGKNTKQKFLGTNLGYANLQVELTALYKEVTGKDLAEGRLRTEQGVLDVLMRLEKKAFGQAQTGSNLPDRVAVLAAKVATLP